MSNKFFGTGYQHSEAIVEEEKKLVHCCLSIEERFTARHTDSKVASLFSGRGISSCGCPVGYDVIKFIHCSGRDE